MDDFNISSLHESKNEWSSRLLTILTPLIVEGLRSIFEEAVNLCKKNNEMDKYLMTFQNYISRIPNWNPNIIDQESKRIIERSHCNYLEELITCVHIIQLKILTYMRVGQKQKKININIPKLDGFVHKTYINVARKIYKNVYLFEMNIPPLQIQKNNRELEIIIQECILNTIRESIPVEDILKAYMDETIEEDVVEDIKEEIIEETVPKDETESMHVSEESLNTTANPLHVKSSAALTFNDLDSVRSLDNTQEFISAPKNIERLEEISNMRNIQRKLEEEEEEDGDEKNTLDKLTIHDQPATLSSLDVHVISDPIISLNDEFLLDDIEILV